MPYLRASGNGSFLQVVGIQLVAKMRKKGLFPIKLKVIAKTGLHLRLVLVNYLTNPGSTTYLLHP